MSHSYEFHKHSGMIWYFLSWIWWDNFVELTYKCETAIISTKLESKYVIGGCHTSEQIVSYLFETYLAIFTVVYMNFVECEHN